MSSSTTNLGLLKPDPAENWSVQNHFNANMEKIDQFAGRGFSNKSGNLIDIVKTFDVGTYSFRLDNASGFPVSGGVVYKVVKTHGTNDTRCSIIALPMASNAPVYSAFVGQNATGITWVQLAVAGKTAFTPVIPRITYSELADNYAIRSGDIVHARARFKVNSVDTGNTYINGNSFPIFGGTLRYISGIWSDENNDTGGEIHGSSNGNAWFMKNGANYRLDANAGHTIWISATYAIDNS